MAPSTFLPDAIETSERSCHVSQSMGVDYSLLGLLPVSCHYIRLTVYSTRSTTAIMSIFVLQYSSIIEVTQIVSVFLCNTGGCASTPTNTDRTNTNPEFANSLEYDKNKTSSLLQVPGYGSPYDCITAFPYLLSLFYRFYNSFSQKSCTSSCFS